jgi:AcrR family transcriptional regulator
MSAELENRPRELRDRIVDATLRVIQERGMARTRTSAIAAAAGCAEGSIYRYFSGKPELLYEVVRSRLPGAIDLLLGLPARAGTATLRTNLLEVARAALDFYGELVPIAAGVLADAELLTEQQRFHAGAGLRPRKGAEELEAYLLAEQELGRVRASADPALAATLLLDGCLGKCFVDALLGRDADGAGREGYAGQLVGLLVRELEPEASR